MEESELESEVELLEGSVEGRLMSEKGVPEGYVLNADIVAFRITRI